jgi:SsrA-binding protein
VHAKEIRELKLKTEAKGLTLIPLKVYLKGGRIKVALGVCRGKAQHDKRDALKQKAMRREMQI